MEKFQAIISSRDNLVNCYRYAESLGYEKPFVIEIKPLTRTIDQNAKLHAMFSELEDQAELNGQKFSADQWKCLMISAHTIATKEKCKMVIGIEGEIVNVRESSAKMSVARLCSLIEYIYAWGSGNGVVFKD